MSGISRIAEDPDLLGQILAGGEEAPGLYKPGPYWKRKSRYAARELKRRGLADFRGTSSLVGLSFADNEVVDLRMCYRSGGAGALMKTLTNIPGFRQIFDYQARIAEGFFHDSLMLKREYLQNSERVRSLTDQYAVTQLDTTRGGCISSVWIGGSPVSFHYLQLLDTLDLLRSATGIRSLKEMTVLEIGGGFGANVHLMVDLLGLRKVIYLDIAPNLYVGTQYLKSFFGDAVVDFRASKDNVIHFRNDDSLEIFCILPHQIEAVRATIDLFHNAHSFVEMPEAVVSNYAAKVSSLMEGGSGLAHLVTYEQYDPSTTLNPNFLERLFCGSCQVTSVDTLIAGRRHLHYSFSDVSVG